MKNFFKEHIFSVTVFFAMLFAGGVISSYVWGIGYLVIAANHANSDQVTANTVAQFDLETAAKINYRGALPTSTPSSISASSTQP
jgi:hypothetical protein